MAKVFTSIEEKCLTWLSSLNYQDFNLESVQIYDVKGIDEIHPSIVTMKKLEYLNLIDNEIKEIPKELCMMTQLKLLFLDDNLISCEGIPENITNLTQLTELSLSNKMTYIPECICDLISLENISLSGNDFSSMEFTDSLSKLTNLKNLNLANTKLENIPIQICNIPSLIVLILDDNNISSIPRDISKLISLKTLHLQNNQISDVKPLKPLTKLTELFLYDNYDFDNYTSFSIINAQSYLNSLED
eukprot:TRINITY_DN567_c0_g1_i2.p1 TRINITY_DN567_c0_g1~~TRINITY_DN567_c0_g1_i2.p1  ORF type:complete len:245 (-),score=35.52 TRINITY_DN567_c0_g1_i2:39-773(-)